MAHVCKGMRLGRGHVGCFCLLVLRGSEPFRGNHNNQCVFDSKLFPFLVQIVWYA